MAQLALARKYRPRRFADLVGQEHVAAGLAGGVAQGRVAHAYLLTGPRGVGKTSAARILAMALNCERRDDSRTAGQPDGGVRPDVPPSGSPTQSGEPCGECDSCNRIWAGSASLDVVEIDAASNRGVDDARELRERAMYAASGANRHKVYIIDEAHMLTREAWNALLKILEEPPPQVVFVFATTEPQKIASAAAPVLSRLQRFDFRRLGPGAVAERLRYVAKQESIRADDEALKLIARVAEGGMRDALSLLDQALVFGDGGITAAGVREALGLIDDEVYGELLGILAARRPADVFGFVERLVEAGADLGVFVNGAGDVLRALMLQVINSETRDEGRETRDERRVTRDERRETSVGRVSDTVQRAAARHAAQFSAGDVLRMLKLLAEAEQVIRRTPNARLHVETLLLQWTLLDRTVELSEVMDAVEGRLGGSAARRTALEPPAAQPPSRSAAVEPPAAQPPSRQAAVEPSAAQPPSRPAAGPISGDLSLEAIKERWLQILDLVSKKKRMLRESMGHATPAKLAEGSLHLAVDGAMHLEGLDRGKSVIAEAVAEATGHKLRVVLEAPSAVSSPAPAGPERLDPKGDREGRLKAYRGKDPALDTAADLLDLELTE